MDPIKVENVHFYPQQNAKQNYTEEYDLVNSVDSPAPVFRRGQSFYLAVTFNRPFDEQIDVVRISFSIGKRLNLFF